MKILFVEPPKDVWFVMGEYLPPPYGIIQLAAFLDNRNKEVEIEVLDCNAQQVDWQGLEKHIASSNPDIVASSSLSTCNTYAVARTLETAKKVNPDILTVTGGQHFTATAEDSLRAYPEMDVIVRGEGEETLAELVANRDEKATFPQIKGISFRHQGKIVHNPQRPLIENLENLCPIAKAARGCLQASPYYILRRISCDYKDGVLTLKGNLSSFYEKQIAQETVSNVEGATLVVNEIEVD